MDKRYITVEEFLNNANITEKTFLKKYKNIPGVTFEEGKFLILKGTRYPYNMRHNKPNTSLKKKMLLLKAIANYKYISHREIGVEVEQFKDFLTCFLKDGFIKCNYLCNEYGANYYDITNNGEEYLRQSSLKKLRDVALISSESMGVFVGTIISKVYNK